MKEIKLPVEVQLVLRKDTAHLDTMELLLHLQDIVDEWYWRQIPIIPCAIINNSKQ